MMQVGFVGVGGIAQEHLKNVATSSFAKVVAVCDIDPEAAQRAATTFAAKAYTDYRTMINEVHLDAVFVCVPPFAHGDMEKTIAERGIHLFVEKPLGLDMSLVHANAAICQERNIITGTGYCLRYWDIVQEAVTFLENRQIALVVGYYCTSFVPTPWWREQDKSGGQLVEQTTHIVDLMRYLAGEITSVHAQMNLIASRNVEGLNIPDVGVVNCTYSSGAVGTLYTTFLQPDHRSGIEIMGNGFRVRIDGDTLTLVDGDKTETRKSTHNFYHTQDIRFLEAVQTGNRSLVLCPYEEAAKTLEVTLAANTSAMSGNMVRFTP